MSGTPPMLGHRALRLLIALKFRGGMRLQARRLRRPSGWIFAILGFLLFSAWISSVWISGALRRPAPVEHESLVLGTQVGLLVLCVMTLIGAFNHRGLYLPKEEIELAFSAPIARSDLVRYRMLTNLLRSTFAGILFGLGAARRMPVGVFGFLGVLVTLLTIPILGQAAAVLLGDVENRVAKLAKRLPLRPISGLLGAAVAFGMLWLLFADDRMMRDVLGAGRSVGELAAGFTGSPVVRAVLLPLKPWALMVTAPDAMTFLAWLAVCLAFWVAAFELTARIPVDFRELSLATSADVARRLARIRRGGGGASVGRLGKPALGWRVPWLLGRGGFGAIAWLKLASIVRKARGTMLVSVAIIAFVTLFLTMAFHDGTPEDVIWGAVTLAVVGTGYLCAGLRFDFRSDLEQMEQIKAWPARPASVFLATILPEVLLVSALLAAGILVRAVATQAFHMALLGILAFQPLVTFAWVALDNAVFLYAPVRTSPGQEGALQHIGRSLALMLLRLALLVAVVIGAGLPAGGVFLVLTYLLGASEVATLWAAGAVAWTGLLVANGALVLVGARMLQRFDVARDRG